MASTPSGIEDKAALLALMSLVNEASNTELREAYGFTISGQLRLRLEKQGYVTSRRDGGLPGRPFVFELTERGWRRGREELRAAPPEKSAKAYRLLYGFLKLIDRDMTRSGRPLEEFFVAETEAPAQEVVDAVDAEQLIRAAYAQLAKEPGSPVRLRLLREHLPDVPREEVDAALLRLVLMPAVYLEPETKQRLLAAADWDAAITIGGEARHLLTIGQS